MSGDKKETMTETQAIRQMPPCVARMMDLDLIEPDPQQPRRNASDPDTLNELKTSIGNLSLIQPIVVRPHPSKSGKFMILVGERRWCAAMALGIKAMPVVIRENLSETEILEIQIAENLPGYRNGLSPTEKAEALAKLKDLLKLDQKALAKRLGKSQSWIAQTLALKDLSPEIQKFKIENPKLASDTTTLISLDKLHREDPAAAKALMEKAKAENKLHRANANEELKKAKAAKKGQKEDEPKPLEQAALHAMVGPEEVLDDAVPISTFPGNTSAADTDPALRNERVNRTKVKKVTKLLGVSEDIDLNELLERLMDEVMAAKGEKGLEPERAAA